MLAGLRKRLQKQIAAQNSVELECDAEVPEEIEKEREQELKEIEYNAAALNEIEKERERELEEMDAREARSAVKERKKAILVEPTVVRAQDGTNDAFATMLQNARANGKRVLNAEKEAVVKRVRGETSNKREPEALYIPPISFRNPNTPGGKHKPDGVVFRALFTDARPLLRLLMAFEGLFHWMPLLFDDTGLHVSTMDVSNVMMLTMHVPRAAFTRYDSYCAETCNTCMLSTQEVRKFSRLVTAEHTVQFLRDQYEGNKDEPLHIQLYPRRQNASSNAALAMKLSTQDVDSIELNASYQYAVHITRPEQLVDAVRQLADQSNDISLSLCDAALVLTTIGIEGISTTLIELPAQLCQLQHTPENTTEAAAHCDEKWAQVEAYKSQTLLIERLPNADANKVSMVDINCYQISAGYLRKALNFTSNTNCVGLTLEFGILHTIDDAGEYTGKVDTLPLRVSLRHCNSDNQNYTTTLWVCPKFTH